MCCQPRQKRACFRVLLGLFLHFFQIDGMEPRDSRSEFSALRRWGLVSFDKNQDFRSHRKNPLIWNLQGSSRSLISFCSKKSQNPTFWGFRVPRKGGTVEEQLRNCRCAQKCSRSEVSGSGSEYRTLADTPHPGGGSMSLVPPIENPVFNDFPTTTARFPIVTPPVWWFRDISRLSDTMFHIMFN